jgi:hypothetical protein
MGDSEYIVFLNGLSVLFPDTFTFSAEFTGINDGAHATRRQHPRSYRSAPAHSRSGRSFWGPCSAVATGGPDQLNGRTGDASASHRRHSGGKCRWDAGAYGVARKACSSREGSTSSGSSQTGTLLGILAQLSCAGCPTSVGQLDVAVLPAGVEH